MNVIARIEEVLSRLSLLSEAGASAPLSRLAPPEDLPKDMRPDSERGFGRANPKPHHESSIPAGVRLRPSDSDSPPSKERSLSDWWRWRFAKAIQDEVGDFELYRLCLIAERDWATRVFHSPDRMALRSGRVAGRDVKIYACPLCPSWKEIGTHTVAPECTGPAAEPGRPGPVGHERVLMQEVAAGDRAEDAAAQRVIELYEGVPAVEVAVHEYTSEAWVKKVRSRAARNPEDGRPKPEFLEWDEERRSAEVAALVRKGLGKKAAAKRLGVNPDTVRRYWPAEPEPLAA